jgi:hypothetical protein
VQQAFNLAVSAQDRRSSGGHGVEPVPGSAHPKVAEARQQVDQPGADLGPKGRDPAAVAAHAGRLGRVAEDHLAVGVLVKIEVLRAERRSDVNHHAPKRRDAASGYSRLVAVRNDQNTHASRPVELGRERAGESTTTGAA